MDICAQRKYSAEIRANPRVPTAAHLRGGSMVHLARQSTPGRRLAAAAVAAATVTSVLAACGGSSGGSGASGPAPGTINKSLSGTTLNFLMPPWGDMGKAEFQKFTQRTGIKVNLQI